MKQILWIAIILAAALLIGSSAFATQQHLPQLPELTAAIDNDDSGSLPLQPAVTYEPGLEDALPAPTVEIVEEPEQGESESDNVPQEDRTAASTVVTPALVEQDQVLEEIVAPLSVIEVTEEVEAKKLPATPFSLRSPRDYNLLTKITVKNTGDTRSTGIRLQVPLLSGSSLYQGQAGDTFSIEPSEIQTQQGIRIGVFALGDLEPGAQIILELRYNVATSVIQFFDDYVPVKTGNLPTVYLQPDKKIQSNNRQITSLSARLTNGLDSDWEKAKAITHWVSQNIIYDASAANRNGGALQALQTGRGVCEDYATLSAALARAAGIPARVAYGYADSGRRWPPVGAFSLSGFRHAWVEYYLDGYGWVPAEPTRSRTKLYFGTLPHSGYIVQNYNDISLRGNFRGGKLAISWTDSLE